MHIRDGVAGALPRPVSRAVGRSSDPVDIVEVGPAPTVSDAPPAIGTTRPFFVWDFSVMPPLPKQISATLRGIGDRGEIWVDDAAWNKTVSPEAAETINQHFNRQSTPGSVDPGKGIAEIDTAYFGDLPAGVDKSPRAIILISDFASFQGTTMDGYFNPFDQMSDTDAQAQGQRSNEKNIIYLNSAGKDVASDYMLGVLSHEFSHLCQFGKGGDQPSWFGEMLGEVAMVANGYHTDSGLVARHQAHPDRPLVTDSYVDYGAVYLFGTYLLEHYGKGFIQQLTTQPNAGPAAINDALAKDGLPGSFATLYDDWVVANYADSHNVVDPRYHYATLNVPAPTETTLSTNSSGTLEASGVSYQHVSTAGQVSVQADGPVSVQVMTFDGPRVSVSRPENAASFQVPADGVVAIAAPGDKPLHYSLHLASGPA